MRINVKAFIAIVLCIVLWGGFWLLKYRGVSESQVWNPYSMYGTLGGSSYSSLNMSSGRSASSGSALSLPAVRTMSRGVSSYAPAMNLGSYGAVSYPSSNLSFSGSVATSRIYTTSDAQFHSFGGGAMSDVVGGSLRTNMDAPSATASVSMPSMPFYAVERSSSLLQSEQTTHGSSAIVAAAPSFVPANSLLASMRGSIYQVGANSLLLQTNYAGYSINANKKASSIGGLFDEWLQGLVGSGFGTLNPEDGLCYFGNSALEDAYLAAVANGQLPVGATWEQFLVWFEGQGDKYAFLPMPDGMCFMCILALLYVVLMIRKRKIVKTI